MRRLNLSELGGDAYQRLYSKVVRNIWLDPVEYGQWFLVILHGNCDRGSNVAVMSQVPIEDEG